MSNTMETYDIEGSDVAEEERRLLQVAGRADEQSLWNTTKRGILKRKTKWIQRFASGLTEDNIKPPVLTYHEKRLLLMKASGWEPLEVVLPELPMAPDLTRIEDVDRFPTRLHSTTLCAKCWKSVPVGVERVCCVICDVVCHRGCIADVAPFVSKRKVMGEEIKSSKGKSKGKSISSSRTPDKKLDAPLASAVQTPMSTSLPVTVTAPTTTTTAKSEKALSLSAQKLFNDIDNGKNVKIHDPSAELYANVRKVLSSAQNISRTASGTLGGVVLRGEHGMSESRVNGSVGTDRAPSQNKASTGSSFVSPAPGNRTKSMDQYNDIVNAINIVNMAEKQNYGVNTCNDKQMQTECVETDLTACALEWHCPFCVDSVNAYNKKLQVRYEKSAHQWNMLRATLHLQSFVRMVAPRIQFLTARAGVIRAQRKFRSRIFWLKMASDTINVPRPVRFKVHDMLIVFKTTDTPIANPPRDIGHEKGLVGQMMSSVFPAYAQYESNGRELPEQ